MVSAPPRQTSPLADPTPVTDRPHLHPDRRAAAPLVVVFSKRPVSPAHRQALISAYGTDVHLIPGRLPLPEDMRGALASFNARTRGAVAADLGQIPSDYLALLVHGAELQREGGDILLPVWAPTGTFSHYLCLGLSASSGLAVRYFLTPEGLVGTAGAAEALARAVSRGGDQTSDPAADVHKDEEEVQE